MLRGQIRDTTADSSPARVKALLARWYRERAEHRIARRLNAVSEPLPWARQPPDPLLPPPQTRHARLATDQGRAGCDVGDVLK